MNKEAERWRDDWPISWLISCPSAAPGGPEGEVELETEEARGRHTDRQTREVLGDRWSA